MRRKIKLVLCVIRNHQLQLEKYQDWDETKQKRFDAGIKVFCPKCNLFYGSKCL